MKYSENRKHGNGNNRRRGNKKTRRNFPQFNFNLYVTCIRRRGQESLLKSLVNIFLTFILFLPNLVYIVFSYPELGTIQ